MRLRRQGRFTQVSAAFGLVAGPSDPIALTIVDATALTGGGAINPNGGVAAVTFKGMATGLTLDASKITFDCAYPGFDSTGAATTITKTVTGLSALRKPLPPVWVNGLVAAAESRCTSAAKVSSSTRVYSTTTGGTCATGSTPVHTSGTVTGADLVPWTYVASIGDVSSVINASVRQYLDAASGSDAIAYVVLDQYVPVSATISNVAIQANAYGASNASRASLVTLTNSSAFTALRPDVAVASMPWQLYGATLTPEVAVCHPYGQSGRMAACVVFKVYDSAGTVTAVTSTVTSMAASATITAGKTVYVFKPSIDISSLADGLYSWGFEVYPFRGASYISGTHGFGPTAPSISSVMTANVSKRIPFRKDAAATFGRVYAYVDVTLGNDATGQASTTAATAASLPFATINAAVRTATKGLQAVSNSALSRNNCGNHVVRLVAGTHVGFHGSSNTLSSAAKGDVWTIIERDPATTSSAADVIITPAASAALKTGMGRVKYSQVTFNGATGPAAVLDNQVGNTAGDFTFETWCDGCVIVGLTGNTQTPFSRMGLLWVTNSTLTHPGTTFGNPNSSRSALKLLAGCTITGSVGFASVAALNALGNIWQTGAVPATTNPTNWWEGTGAQTNPDMGFYAFNTWMDCRTTPKWPVAGQVFTTGASWLQNLVEVSVASGVKGGEHSADGNTTALGHLYDIYCTVAGEGQNLVYNENGTTFTAKMAIMRFCAMMDRNSKGEFYDTAPEMASALRIGNLLSRYAVDYLGNAVMAVTDGTPSPKNLAGEVFEPSSVIVTAGTPAWTSDKSRLGDGLGGGNYVPGTTSSAKSLVPATGQMLPGDLNGTTRRTDGTGAAGALEWA